jgi:hypothetical protein
MPYVDIHGAPKGPLDNAIELKEMNHARGDE